MRLTIFLLLFSLSAQGQFIIDSYRFSAAASLLLDSFPTASAAYSLRLLRTAYTGDAIMVRRSSDNDSLAIGFSGGVLDTAAMKTFCGTGATDTCFVRRLYDQSGNGRNFAQTTSANQPRILTSGVINREAGTPAMVFDGTNDWMEIPSSTAMLNFIHDGSYATFFSVQRFGSVSDPNAVYTLLDNTGSAGANTGFWLNYDDRVIFSTNNAHRIFVTRGNVAGGAVSLFENDKVTPNVPSLLYTLVDADNATAVDRARGGFNGSADYGNNTLTNAPSTSNATFNLTLGALGAATKALFLLGAVQELVIYNADQSTNRTAIETNINNFYSIY
jgi:hypothetical protein